MARRPVRRPARKPAAKSERPATTNGPSAPSTDRDKIVAALLALLADKSFETIGLADVAARAGVSLAQLRDEFPSTFAIIAAHVKATDRAVLAEDMSDMAEEPERERLFDVLMRRLEILAPHRDAIRSLLRSAAPQSAAGDGAQPPGGALAAMDADGRRHRRRRPARYDPRPGARRAVRLGAAHLGQ